MGLIDSHAHLTAPELSGDIDAVLLRCRQADVQGVITVGVNVADARAAVDLAERYADRIHVAAGIHPHEAGKTSSADFDALAALWTRPCVVALGEMGLDYHYDFAERPIQKEVFAQQLALASAVHKPVVIHCREAFDDTTRILVEHGFDHRPVVFHCFTDGEAEAEQVASHGWRISFTGIVTFPKSKDLQAIARDYPADALMIETDSPFLSPVPVRGKQPNEPAHVAHIARFLSDLRGLPYDEFVEQTSCNTKRFFGLTD